MRGSRLFWKVYLGCLALILVATGTVAVTLGRWVERESLVHFEERLDTAAVLARELLTIAPGAGDRLHGIVARIRAQTGVPLLVLRADGTVLADSENHPPEDEGYGNRPEVVAARAGGRGTDTRIGQGFGVETMYVALAVPGGGEAAFVRTALPLDELNRHRSALRRAAAFGVALASLVGLLLSAFLSRSFTRPLVEMAQTARRVAAGQFGVRLEVERDDEIGAFARSFNLMASQLSERIDRLTEDRNKLQTILAAMAEGVVAVDDEERVLHLNAVAARILGTDAEAAAGKPFRSVCRVAEVAEALTEVIRTGVGRNRELLLAAFPKDRVLEIQTGPIPGEAPDAPAGAVVVMHDVTELRRLEAVRRDFVANVSHELKTPLTTVRAVVETLLDDDAMPRETRDRFLHKLDDQSRRLVRIVTDLLTLSRVESRRDEIEREPIDFRLPVGESVRALSGLAEERKVRLSARLPEREVVIRGERASLRLIVDNLVDNALKYTAEGGSVEVELTPDGAWATLQVRDTGIGIDSRHRNRLFERFYRVDTARSRELGGTGLGLAIVKHVASAHDGDVGFESVPGEGSTFRVRIPLAGTAVPGRKANPVAA